MTNKERASMLDGLWQAYLKHLSKVGLAQSPHVFPAWVRQGLAISDKEMAQIAAGGKDGG